MNRIEKGQKKEVIKRLLNGDSPGDLINEYGINERTIYTWSSVINVIREILKEEEKETHLNSDLEILSLKKDVGDLQDQMLAVNKLITTQLFNNLINASNNPQGNQNNQPH